MRAGLIISGLFLMFFGVLLLFTVILALLGLLFGFVGFIMLIVGLVTSGERVVVTAPPTVTTVYAPTPEQKLAGEVKYCVSCGTRNSKDAVFCNKCGRKFIE